jgi:hypothetical protein
MSGEVAGAIEPFQTGFAVTIAIMTCGVLYDTLTTLTLLHDGMALTPIVGTPLFCHEDALCPCLYRLANHGYHLPFQIGI